MRGRPGRGGGDGTHRHGGGRPLAAGCDDITAAGRARAGRRSAAESVSGRSARPGAGEGRAAAGQGGAGRRRGKMAAGQPSPPPPPREAPRHCPCGRLRARGLPGRPGPALRGAGGRSEAGCYRKPVAASGAGGLGLALWGRLAGLRSPRVCPAGARPRPGGWRGPAPPN